MAGDIMSSILWWVTPCLQPNTLIAGPYTTKAECEKVCVILTSQFNKQRAAYGGSMRVTPYYVSRMVRVTVEVAVSVMFTHVPPVQPVQRTPLDKLKLLSRGKLLRIAKSLSLNIPEYYSKAQIAAVVYKLLLEQVKA